MLNNHLAVQLIVLATYTALFQLMHANKNFGWHRLLKKLSNKVTNEPKFDFPSLSGTEFEMLQIPATLKQLLPRLGKCFKCPKL